jgi:hypothetical protein
MTQTERQRKTEENVDMCPVVAPRYESGGEAQACGERRWVLSMWRTLGAFHFM